MTTPTILSELPYHLTEAARWQELHDTLTDFRFLEHKADEVGVEVSGGDGEGETVYSGVFHLQQDFDPALRKIPGGGGAAGGRRPLIVTAVDFGDGPGRVGDPSIGAGAPVVNLGAISFQTGDRQWLKRGKRSGSSSPPRSTTCTRSGITSFDSCFRNCAKICSSDESVWWMSTSAGG